MPKMHCRNLAVLQRSVGDKHCNAAVGMKEDALWVIAGQVTEPCCSCFAPFFCVSAASYFRFLIFIHVPSSLQLLRTIGFLNKHGFAHLDIKRENIVFDHPNTDTDKRALEQLFSPLSRPLPAAASFPPCIDLDKIRVRYAARASASHLTPLQVCLIDFGHATHMLHFSRHIRQADSNICSLDNHCPKGYSAPEACTFFPRPRKFHQMHAVLHLRMYDNAQPHGTCCPVRCCLTIPHVVFLTMLNCSS
jgi:hypothetical protein